MRSLALMLLFGAGCGGIGHDGDCHADNDCGGGNVCTRNSECLPPSEVRAARVTWTIRGMPANDMLCAPTPNFYVMFAGTQLNDEFGFSPVPCKAGLFSIDKLPRRFVSVEIGVDGRFAEVKALDAQGNVAFDLVP